MFKWRWPSLHGEELLAGRLRLEKPAVFSWCFHILTPSISLLRDSFLIFSCRNVASESFNFISANFAFIAGSFMSDVAISVVRISCHMFQFSFVKMSCQIVRCFNFHQWEFRFHVWKFPPICFQLHFLEFQFLKVSFSSQRARLKPTFFCFFWLLICLWLVGPAGPVGPVGLAGFLFFWPVGLPTYWACKVFRPETLGVVKVFRSVRLVLLWSYAFILNNGPPILEKLPQQQLFALPFWCWKNYNTAGLQTCFALRMEQQIGTLKYESWKIPNYHYHFLSTF